MMLHGSVRGRVPDVLILLVPLAIVVVNGLIAAFAPTTAFSFDDAFQIDLVWRVVSGQVPSTDFSSPFGFGIPYIASLFWGIGDQPRAAMIMATGIVAFVIVITACILMRGVFSRSVTLLALSIIAAEASGPTVYGYGAWVVGQSANYTRLSVAALGALFLGLFARRPTCISTRGLIVQGAAMAVLLNITFTLKISTFVFGVVICCGAAVVAWYQGDGVARLLSIGVIFLGVLIVGEFVLAGLSPSALWEDYRVAATARSSIGPRLIVNYPEKFWMTFLALFALSAFIFAAFRETHERVRGIVVVFGFWVIQLALNMTNAQPETLYLLPFCALVLASYPSAQLASWGALIVNADRQLLLSRLWRYPLQSLCGFYLAVQALLSIMTLGIALGTMTGANTITTLNHGGRTIMMTADIAGDGGRSVGYIKKIGEGLKAIEDSGIGYTRIMALDYANPFPFILGYPPPKGVGVNIAPGYNLPTDSKELERYLFGDACVIMRPREFTPVIEHSAASVDRASEATLKLKFELIYAGSYWGIYRAKRPCGEASHP